MKDQLQKLRRQIDALDARLVKLLNERTRRVLKIGRLKQATGGEIYAPDREEAVLQRVLAQNTGPLTAESLRAIYREVMSSALALEKPLVIAYLGPPGTYSHMASVRKFGASLRYEPLPSIADVFTEVAKGRADYGVVPIENSTEGAVTHTYDMFVESELKVCAQILLPIRHNLMSAGPREQIQKLYSISQVFAQCRQWVQVNFPHAELVEVFGGRAAGDQDHADECEGQPVTEAHGGILLLSDSCMESHSHRRSANPTPGCRADGCRLCRRYLRGLSAKRAIASRQDWGTLPQGRVPTCSKKGASVAESNRGVGP